MCFALKAFCFLLFLIWSGLLLHLVNMTHTCFQNIFLFLPAKFCWYFSRFYLVDCWYLLVELMRTTKRWAYFIFYLNFFIISTMFFLSASTLSFRPGVSTTRNSISFWKWNGKICYYTVWVQAVSPEPILKWPSSPSEPFVIPFAKVLFPSPVFPIKMRESGW